MDGVATPIIGRPRPLPGHDTPNPAYHPHTLNYEEPVNQASTGGLTWSDWQGAKGWAIYVAANSAGLLGTAGYLGFRHGFTKECWSHYSCYAH